MRHWANDESRMESIRFLETGAGEQMQYPDLLLRYVGRLAEQVRERSLPHVLKPLRSTFGNVRHGDAGHIHWGQGDPGDLDNILRGGPLYVSSLHSVDIPPGAPVRGAHRHAGAAAIVALQGKGWERHGLNGEIYYEFEEGDILTVPPYTNHQHGAVDPEAGAFMISASPVRVRTLMSLFIQEHHKLSEKPVFPEGTEPLYDEKGMLKGWRVKKGVLGLEEDFDIMLGSEPKSQEAFDGLVNAGPWEGEVKTTYDRYLKQRHDTSELLRTTPRGITWKETPWELTRHGQIRVLLYPESRCATKTGVVYFQQLSPTGRSGKHRHLADEWLYVVKGRGYDVHDGEHWVWEEGDLICIPPMVTHQHFNDDPNEPALLLSASSSLYANLGVGGIEQLEDAPEYQEEGGA